MVIHPEYEIQNRDCIPAMLEMQPASIDLAVFSPPFSSLYAYTNADADMGNSRESDDEFMLHFDFFARALAPLIKPGRNVCMHLQQVSRFKSNHGYMGLYGGLGAQDIHLRKGLKKGEQILDHMGSTELAANLFRATQAEDKLRREKITGKDKANKAHNEVGAKVRQTIKELGGTMPEELPPAESIRKLESKARKALKRPDD